jgi:hypothetical protein
MVPVLSVPLAQPLAASNSQQAKIGQLVGWDFRLIFKFFQFQNHSKTSKFCQQLYKIHKISN